MAENNTTKNKPTFGKIMLASAVGTLIVMVCIGIFKLLMFFGIVGSLSKDDVPVVAKGTFLKIDLTSALEERSPSELNSWINKSNSVGFNDMLRSINAAANDEKIDGIYLYMGSSYPHSWGRSEELRHTLELFCESGKPVFAYADNYSQQSYFLASVADSIYMNPSGILFFQGIGAEGLFFKEMLDKLAVKMTLVRPKSNNFKSAGEMYTMNHMSDANRAQIRQYINSIWQYVIEQIAEARDISTEDLNQMANDLTACLPEDAINRKLIDRLCFENDVVKTMEKDYGSKNTIELSDYCKTVKPTTITKDKIAVIYAEGDVVEGDGINTAVYSDKITKALDNAAKDDNIKASVLRVNSPGGQVTASEIMTNAVIRAKAKKPVVVSMGDVAASAGYEISCNAHYIVAQPTTITGSIGVFASIPEVGGTLRRYLGITTDTVLTNTNAAGLSIMRPMSPKVLELMQRNVEEFYTVFVNRVAKGRGLKYDFVDSIARGRVWTGRDALKLGLVDALGGLDDAISIAADSAGIKNYTVIDYPANESIMEELSKFKDQSSGTAKIKTLAPQAGDRVWIGGNAATEALNRILETRGLQARVEFLLITE